MKNIPIIFVLVFIFSGINNFAFAQCKQQFEYVCPIGGQEIPINFFNTKLKKTNSYDNYCKNFVVSLNKGSHYRINYCTPEGFDDKVVLTLYNQNFEKADSSSSTWNREKNKNYSSFDFVCQYTGLYFISISFKDDVEEGTQTCAVGVLSFVGKNR
jgi:hypothetical protein